VAITARAAYNELGHHVEVPAPTGDPETEELLAAARERWNSAGAVLATARSGEELRLAESIAREGLAAVAHANVRLGRQAPGDPG
jgi:hypothetical protein